MDLDLVGDNLHGPFVEHLGLHLTEVTPDRVTCTWTADKRHHQPYGIVHGGVHASVVETLASIGAATWLSHERGRPSACVGVSNTTDFFKAVREGDLSSVATPIHRGRSQQVWQVEIHDAAGRLVARGQVRLQNMDS